MKSNSKQRFKKIMSLCLFGLTMLNIVSLSMPVMASAATDETTSGLVYHSPDTEENPLIKNVTDKVLEANGADVLTRTLPDYEKTEIKFYIEQKEHVLTPSVPGNPYVYTKVESPEGCTNWKKAPFTVIDIITETNELVEYPVWYCAGCTDEEHSDKLKSTEIIISTKDEEIEYHTTTRSNLATINTLVENKDGAVLGIISSAQVKHLFCDNTICEKNFDAAAALSGNYSNTEHSSCNLKDYSMEDCEKNGCLSDVLYHRNDECLSSEGCAGHRGCLGFISEASSVSEHRLTVNYLGGDRRNCFFIPSETNFTTDLRVPLSDILSVRNVTFYVGHDDFNGDKIEKTLRYDSDKITYSDYNPYFVGRQKVTVTYWDNNVARATNFIYITTQAVSIHSVCDMSATSASGVYCDTKHEIFYGFRPGISDDINKIAPSEGFDIKVENYGTGGEVIFEHDGDTVYTAHMLIYGDVNGDGWYDGDDADIVSRIVNSGLTAEDYESEPWVYIAADANRDGSVNTEDVELLNKADIALAGVNKENVRKTQNLYNNYCDMIEQGIKSSSNSSSTGTSLLQRLIN